jgi:hypothetical protein
MVVLVLVLPAARAAGQSPAAVSAAQAGDAVPAAPRRDWHVGLNLRTDYGARQARVDAGVRVGPMDWVLVLDPMGLNDGLYVFDALAIWRGWSDRWAPLVGWRTTVIPLEGPNVYHETLVLGATGRLPSLGPLRGEVGFELAAVVVRHGDDLPTQVISFRSARHFGDLVNTSLFVRFEYASAF